jgi:hypothetical protein
VDQMRQSADTQFKQLLQRLRSNSSTNEELQQDFNLITSKIINQNNDLSDWTDAIIIVTINYLRQKLNYVKIRLFAQQNNTAVIICKAKDRLTKNGCSKAFSNRVESMIKVLEEKNTANMMTELPLLLNAKYMSKAQNLATKYGLVNGSEVRLDSIITLDYKLFNVNDFKNNEFVLDELQVWPRINIFKIDR